MISVAGKDPRLNGPNLFQAQISTIWGFLKTQPASFWLVNFYVFIEYVRPQQVWPVIDVLPWGLTALLLSVVAVVFEGKLLKRPLTAVDFLLLVYSGILVLSSMAAMYPEAATAGWELYFSWMLVFVLVTSTMTTEKRFFVFMLAFLLYSFKMSQHGFRTWMSNGFGFSDWGATGGPGWFHNSGEFGIQMCIFLPLSVEFILALRDQWGRLTRCFFYLFPITAVASMVASSSRGALLGGAVVAIWWVARSKHRVRALAGIAVLGAVTWTVVPAEQKTRFAESGEDETSVSRIERWEAGIEMAHQNPVLGIGYNNWEAYYGPLSHNIFIQAWSEMGYSGLFSFLGLIAATFWVNFQTRKLMRGFPTPDRFITHMAYGLDGALIGYMAGGFFVTVLYYPYFWVNLAMTVALHTAARKKRRAVAKAARRHRQAMSQERGPYAPAAILSKQPTTASS